MTGSGSIKVSFPPASERWFSERRDLVGRQTELEELARSGSTANTAILLVGVRGSGRTRLLEEVHAAVSVRCVWVMSNPAEQDRPFSGLSRLLDALGEAPLAQMAGRLSFGHHAAERPLAVAADVLEELRQHSRQQTLVLVDDADRFDDQSQVALAHMAARLAGTGLSLIASVAPSAAESTLAGIRQVPLARLGDELELSLSQCIAPAGSDPRTLRMIARASSGLPGAIRSAIAQLTGEQLLGFAPLALPPFPGEIDHPDAGWGSETTRLMRWMSAAPLTSIAGLLRTHEGNRGHIEQLVFQGSVDVTGSFVSIRDSALRSRLYWSMTLEERVDVHERAAQAEECTALTLWHSDHLEATADDGSSLLAEAADLFEQGLTQAAVELTERALMLGLGAEKTLAALLTLCSRLVVLSELDLAHRYLAMYRHAARSPEQITTCLGVLVTLQALTGENIDVVAIESYVRQYSGIRPESCAELLAFVAMFFASKGEMASARLRIDQAFAILPDTRVPVTSAQHWTRRMVDAAVGAEFEAIHDDRETGQFELLAPSVQLISARALSLEERYVDARYRFAALTLSVPPDERTSAWAARVIALSAENEIFAGHVVKALEQIGALAETSSPRTLRDLLLFSWRELMVGTAAEADPLLREASNRAMWSPHSVEAARLAGLQGTFALMRDDLDEARYRLTRAYETALEVRPDFLRVEGDFVELLARQGDWDRAQQVTSDFGDRVARYPSAWSRVVLARCRAIVAPDVNLVAEFQDALATAVRAEAHLEAARTRLAFSAALRRVGAVALSVEQGRAAEYQFEALAATAWARAARAASAPIGRQESDSPLSALTEQEVAVLKLMQKGVRNREIAAALFVSLRTVEVRITQIYRKLEARSRSHLLTLLPGDLDQITSL